MGRVVRSRILRYIVLPVSLAVAFYALLYVSTEEWRVYRNDVLPSLGWDPIYHRDIWPMLLAWLGPLTLFCLGVAIAARRWKRAWLGLLLLIPAFFLARHYVIRSRQWNSIISCANHANFWMHIHIDPREPLPDSTEFVDLLVAGSKDGWGPLPMGPDEGIGLAGVRCPGYRRAGTRTGMAYVGGGLRLDSLDCGSVLIAFCTWSSHLPPYDRQHCLTAGPEGFFYREPIDTKEMIVRIKLALRRAADGTVPYSADAQEILRFELAKRRELVH
jgi:hypothetical protein